MYIHIMFNMHRLWRSSDDVFDIFKRFSLTKSNRSYFLIRIVMLAAPNFRFAFRTFFIGDIKIISFRTRVYTPDGWLFFENQYLPTLVYGIRWNFDNIVDYYTWYVMSILLCLKKKKIFAIDNRWPMTTESPCTACDFPHAAAAQVYFSQKKINNNNNYNNKQKIT